ncbi:hypothetical protein BKA70DRAFT_1067409, partial [Coprinopsis sp. MPI-PUGE-AT-0042]
LSMGDISYIKGLIDLRPKIFLDEMQDYLYRYRHVEVSVPTLSRTLSRMAFTHKTVSHAALERNELLRATWQGECGYYPADYYIWIDESSVDHLTNIRHKG